MPGRNFFAGKSAKTCALPKRFVKLIQQINRHKSARNREISAMKNQRNSERQNRTRLLIQIGGLVQKAKIMETFNINLGDDLQDYETLNKAARLMGFLSHSLEQFDESEATMAEYERTGERLLRYG
jgi:hypothetical protein